MTQQAQPSQARLPFYIVNAFTTPTSLFSGNQAAVVILPPDDPRERDDQWKALVARDFNFSETSFVVPREDGKFGLRWWTPGQEVVLCGHATLAAAAVLFSLHPSKSTVTFVTRWSGELIATRASPDRTSSTSTSTPNPPSAANSDAIEITLPCLSPSVLSSFQDRPLVDRDESHDVAALFADAANIPTDRVRRAYRFPWAEKQQSSIIELNPDVDLVGLKVDIKAMLAITAGMNIVTQIKEDECTDGVLRIDTRIFAPGAGVDEDPVTGSAHAYLTSYYLATPVYDRLPSCVTAGRKPEEVVIDARQVSARGGALRCMLEGGMAQIQGSAAIWCSGQLNS